MIECKESRVGKAPVVIPKGVEVKKEGLTFTVKVQTDSMTLSLRVTCAQ